MSDPTGTGEKGPPIPTTCGCPLGRPHFPGCHLTWCVDGACGDPSHRPTELVVGGGDVDLVLAAREFAKEVDRLWPGQTIEARGLSLGEEAGEVQRAILKRGHTERNGGVHKGKTSAEWGANLRTEVGQLLGVALDIAHREGFSATDALLDALVALRQMPSLAARNEQS